MDKGGVVLQCLNQVGHQRVFQQDRHRPVSLELPGCDGFALSCLADNDIAKAAFKVGQRIRETENCHDLGRDGDVVTGFAGEAVGDTSQPDRDVAQRTVIDVDDAAP